MSFNLRASLVPAAAVIPAQVAYTDVVAVKKLVVYCLVLLWSTWVLSDSVCVILSVKHETRLCRALPRSVHGNDLLEVMSQLKHTSCSYVFSGVQDVMRGIGHRSHNQCARLWAFTTCSYFRSFRWNPHNSRGASMIRYRD